MRNGISRASATRPARAGAVPSDLEPSYGMEPQTFSLP
jgi:hypothetical protein